LAISYCQCDKYRKNYCEYFRNLRNDWFHAKIVIQYPHVSVYVNGNTSPSLEIDKLNNRKTGKIGLWVGNGSDGDFANLHITNQN
jgi:hypothetical protein